MSQLTEAVDALVTQVGEEQAALLIAGLARTMEPGGRRLDQVINWLGEAPKLTLANMKAVRALADMSFVDRVDAILQREKASPGQRDRITVYADLYAFATDKKAALATAKKDLSAASYQRLRAAVGLSKPRK